MSRLRRWREHPAGSFAHDLFHRFHASRVGMLAAALAYYAAFSLGPLILLLGGWLGVLLETRPELAAQYRTAVDDLLAQVLPLQPVTAERVSRSFEGVLAQLSQGAQLRNLLSVAVLLWASSGFFTSLQLALEVIFDVPESRGFLRKRLVALALVLTVALAIALEMVGGFLLGTLAHLSELLVARLEASDIVVPLLPVDVGTLLGTELLRLLVATTAFAVAFRFLPRRSSSWSGALVGALFSAVSILVTRRLLLVYFNPERFNLVYGVITSLVLVLLWLYLALLLFLVGALLVAEISARQRVARSGGTLRDEAPTELGDALRDAPAEPPGEAGGASSRGDDGPV